MAERSNVSSKKTQDAAQDVSTLQKRGRRRLVGAIALVLLAVIILPMVLDPEPRPNAPLVSVRIPGEEGTKFAPKALPKPPAPEAPAPDKKADAAPSVPAAAAPDAPKPEAPKPVPEPAAEAKPEAQPEAKPTPKPTPKPAAEKPAPKPKAPEKPPTKAAEAPAEKAAPAPAGEQFVVQVAAFASAEKVKEVVDLLKEAKIPHYTESIATANGQVTRVRIGPFGTKDAAERARERVSTLGRAKGLTLNPSNPVAK